MLREISPLFHADKITKPLIVLQGANDPRVIKPESDEIVEAIKKKNGVVEYVVFDNEGHGFTKKANEIRGNKAILDFLDKHLKEERGQPARIRRRGYRCGSGLIHPRYLDAKGLVAAWREGLLAQKVLRGETRGYTRHPQLARFHAQPDPLRLIAALSRRLLAKEASRRGYAFDLSEDFNAAFCRASSWRRAANCSSNGSI